jgi:NNP family nitrate/nitrite transporter-like MFS transporter
MGIAGAGNSGTVLSTLFAPQIAAHIGWHATMGIATIPVIITFFIFTFMASDSPTHPAPKTLGDYAAVLKQPDTWWFCFFYSITFGGFLALVSYLAIFFNTAYGVDKVSVGILVAIASLFGSVLRPVGGYLADKFGGVAELRIVYVVFALLAIGIALSPPLAICQLLVFAAVGSLGMGNGAVFQIVPQRFGAEIGVITGIVGAAGGIGGFYLPNMLGVLRANTGTFASGFYTFAALALIGAVAITLIGRAWNTTFLGREKTALTPIMVEG